MLLRYRHTSKRTAFRMHPRATPGAGVHRATKNSQGIETVRIETATATATSNQSDFISAVCRRADVFPTGRTACDPALVLQDSKLQPPPRGNSPPLATS